MDFSTNISAVFLKCVTSSYRETPKDVPLFFRLAADRRKKAKKAGRWAWAGGSWVWQMYGGAAGFFFCRPLAGFFFTTGGTPGEEGRPGGAQSSARKFCWGDPTLVAAAHGVHTPSPVGFMRVGDPVHSPFWDWSSELFAFAFAFVLRGAGPLLGSPALVCVCEVRGPHVGG
jgi:hypothetical protein